MEEFHYEILLLKYANYLARELYERVRRYELDFDGIMPPHESIISKLDMDVYTYIHLHGYRNLLPILTVTLVVNKPPSPLEEAIRDLAGTTSHLTDYLIPLDVEVTGEADYFDTYLVKEKCIVGVKKMENSTDFIQIKEDSKFKELIESVVKIIGCVYTMNEHLRVKESRVRLERYLESRSKEGEESEKDEKEEVNSAYDLARRFEMFSSIREGRKNKQDTAAEDEEENNK